MNAISVGKKNKISKKANNMVDYLYYHNNVYFCIILFYSVCVTYVLWGYNKIDHYLILSNIIRFSSCIIFLIMMIPFIIKIYKKECASSIIVTTLNAIYFIPSVVLYFLGITDIYYFFIVIMYWSIMIAAQLHIPIFFVKIDNKVGINKALNYLAIFLFLFAIFILYKYTGFKLLFSLTDVYEVRRASAQFDLPRAVSYILSMAPIIMAVLLIHFLTEKKIILIIISILTEWMFFSFGGHKSIAFMSIMVVILYLIYGKNRLHMLFLVSIVVAVFGKLETIVKGTGWIISLFFRRCMYVPALLSAQYTDYIHNPVRNNVIDIFRQSILGKLGFSSAYPTNLPHVLGSTYSTETVAANNGLIGDAYTNLGFLGIILMPIIIILCLRILDFATYKLNGKIIIGICIYFATSFANSTWSTVVLTHGMLAAAILFYLFPRKEKLKDARN